MKKCNYMHLPLQMSDVIDDNKFIVPQFQRNVVWKKQRRKDFITNIRNGEPFGVILVRQNNGKYELIDGLQRITTIRDYYENPYDYLNENDVDDELSRKIVKAYLEEQKIQIDETYVETRSLEIKKELFNCLKGELKNWEAADVLKEKLGINATSTVRNLIDDVYAEFNSNIEIDHLPVFAIDYRGPSENIPNVFYNLNTGGVQLSKYETYAALWSKPLFVIDDEQLLENVKMKYKKLQDDSDLDIVFSEDDMSQNGISLFEYCYALSGVIRNKTKGYDILFGENSKSTDPIGFELLSLILGESVNKAERIHSILKDTTPSFLVSLKKLIDDSVFNVKNALKDILLGKNGATLHSDSTYLIYHIIVSYIREYYIIDVKSETITKKQDTLPVSDFKKYMPLHYVYDCLTDYWKNNRQVSDLNRDLNSLEKRTKYWSNIKIDDWADALHIFVESQSGVSKTIPQRNKLFIDFLISMKLKKNPQYMIHFLNSADEKSGYLDFEHIVPRKIIQNHIKDLTTSQQNLFNFSHVGNLCYLTVKDNRSKREKTIYEYVEDRPSYTFDEEYLKFNGYPEKDDLKFIHYSNSDFRDEYAKFIKYRTDILSQEFLELIKELF